MRYPLPYHPGERRRLYGLATALAALLFSVASTRSSVASDATNLTSGFGPGCTAREFVYLDRRLLVVASPTNVVLNVTNVTTRVPEAGFALLTLTLASPDGVLACPVSVDVKTVDGTAKAEDGDFTALNTSFVFNAGEGSGANRTVSVPITPDTQYEGDEAFQIAFGNLRGARMSTLGATITIVDDDPLPTIRLHEPIVAEGSGGLWSLKVTPTLSNASAFPVTVNFTTADGTALQHADYTPTNGTITFLPRTTSADISIPIVGDGLYEGDEYFFLRMSDPSGASLPSPSARITLTEDDPPSLSISNVRLAEGNLGRKAFTFDVALQGPSRQKIYVDYRTEDCSATASSGDYVPTSGRLYFPEQTSSSQSITVPVNGDTLAEGLEVFKVVLSNPVAAVLAKAVGNGTIVNDDKSPASPARMDFNGDGSTDLILESQASHELQIWYLEGDKRLGGPAAPFPSRPVADGWMLVGANDFNGDSRPDLLWWNQNSGRLSFWIMNGLTRVDGVNVDGEPDLSWRIVGTGDMDLDGRPDLIWRNEVSGHMRVWRLQGTSLVETLAMNPDDVEPIWDLVAIGDLNGDGKNDLLFRHRTSGALVYWFMDGLRRIDGGFVAPSPLPVSWRVVSIFDLDLDNKNDIVFQNDGSGDLAVLHMNGVAEYCGTLFEPARPDSIDVKAIGPR